MATNQDVIGDALRLIGVLSEVDTVTAEQAAHGLRVMNDLFTEWDADDIDVGFYPQTDINGECPIDADVVSCFKHSLAIALSPHYGATPSPAVIAIASKGYSRLLRDAIVQQLRPASMSHLPQGEASPARYSILTDEFR